MALIAKSLRAEEIRSVAIPIIAIGVVLAILYFGRVFFITSILAVVIAFILEPFVALLVRFRMPRSLASFLVCVIALFLVYLIGLGAYTQISGLVEDLPKYGQRMSELIEGGRRKVETMEEAVYQIVVPARQRKSEGDRQFLQQADQSKKKRRNAEPAPPAQAPGTPAAIPEVRIHQDPIADYVSARLSSFYRIALMLSFVPFLVYFMLSWRDHMHRSFLQFFHGEDRMIAAKSLAGIADMVRAFVVGNFMLGLLLAGASSLAFWLIHVPFPLLVGPLSGLLSLVPYIGLPLAIIPPLLVGLTAVKALSGYLLIVLTVVILHLLALNLLYPKIVGSRVHLNPLIVTFALMIWGFLWDAAGLLLAIPMTAAIKAVCDNVKGLRPYGKFLGD